MALRLSDLFILESIFKFDLLNESWFLPEGYYGTFLALRFFLVGWRCAYPTCLSWKVFLSSTFSMNPGFCLKAITEHFWLCAFFLSDGASLIRPTGIRAGWNCCRL